MAERRLTVIQELTDAAQSTDLNKDKEGVTLDSSQPSKELLMLSSSENTLIETESQSANKTEEKISDATTPEELLKPIEPLIEKLKKTRGVTTIFGITKNGQVIPLLTNKELDLEQFSKILSDNMTILSKFVSDLFYWVIQFEKGLMILQRFSPELTLAVVGDESTNFGTLHYIMDKNHS